MRYRLPSTLLAWLLLVAVAAPARAQISNSDVTFLRLSTQTFLQTYREQGHDPAPINAIVTKVAPLAATDRVGFYRGMSQALTLLKGANWSPETELATALDFTIGSKILEPGETLRTAATYIFDAPETAKGPYRLELAILKTDESTEAAVPQAIELGPSKGRKAGELVGAVFVPSKLVSPGLHLIRATLKDSTGTTLGEYYRSFFLISDYTKRTDALARMLDSLPDQQHAGVHSARYVLDAAREAHDTYLGGAYQNLVGFLHTVYRGRGYAKNEVMNFDDELTRATKTAEGVRDRAWSLDLVRGDQKLAYRSTFDGKLVPYRIYVPKSYDKSKKYPVAVFLHGAGGDENSFFEGYQKLFSKLAEERGYIIIGANGRGPLGGYSKESGGEQDMLDLFDLATKTYNIDPTRIYLGGHSMGSSGTWRLGFEYRDRFAALAPMAGTRMNPQLERTLASGRKVPLVIVAGGKDALVPVEGVRTAQAKAKELGYDVKYLEYPEGDHTGVVTLAVKDVFDFFDAHRHE